MLNLSIALVNVQRFVLDFFDDKDTFSCIHGAFQADEQMCQYDQKSKTCFFSEETMATVPSEESDVVLSKPGPAEGSEISSAGTFSTTIHNSRKSVINVRRPGKINYLKQNDLRRVLSSGSGPVWYFRACPSIVSEKQTVRLSRRDQMLQFFS